MIDHGLSKSVVQKVVGDPDLIYAGQVSHI